MRWKLKLGSIAVVLLCVVWVLTLDGYADHFDLIEPVFSKWKLFSDENISVMFMFPRGSLGYEGIHFHISNKSEHAIAIDWNRSSIISPSGQVSNVIHEGVKFISAGTTLPPTTLPPGGSLLDHVVPTRNIHYSSSVGWLVLPMHIKQGDQFGMYLALEVGAVSRGYNFVFRATEMEETTEEAVEEELRRSSQAREYWGLSASLYEDIVGTVGRFLLLMVVGLGLVLIVVDVLGR